MMGYIRADRKEDPTALGATALILGCLRFFSARVRTGAEAVTLNMSKAPPLSQGLCVCVRTHTHTPRTV